MKPIFLYLIILFLLPLLANAQTVVALKIDGTINPVTADFIHQGIEKAEREKAECLLIELNTPGGLLKSTRIIVSDLIESPVPVVVFVSPSGAHAGSAGVFITLAAHVAVMAPGTNLGAAHPVDLQNQQQDYVMNDKVTNDAAAFIRSIAEKRQRNSEWAEEAVRKSVSITENEAVEKKVVNFIAKNTEDLLNQLDGKIVESNSGTKVLHTRSAKIEWMEMGFMEKILNLISDPNIAYLLLMLGIYGILFELYNPGSIFPGIVGVIAIVLAFYSMHALPVNYAGLALIIFGVVLLLLEIKIVSHGLLALGGIASLLIGSLMLIRTSPTIEFVRISRSIIISAVATTAFFFLAIIGLGLKAQRAKPTTGIEGLIGETGESLELLSPSGKVFVHGETWQAETVAGSISKGEKVRVVGIKNLTLHVEHLIS